MRELKVSSGIKRSTSIEALSFNLLNSRTVIHIAHLGITGPGSFAAHKALGEYYESIGDLTDSLIEQHQGIVGRLMTFPETVSVPSLKSAEDCCGYLKTLRASVDTEQASCPYSELCNIMDEVKSLIDSTCYKLTFLK